MDSSMSLISAFLFPGQGSQQRGMGRDLFDTDGYRVIENDVNQLLGYSVREVCTSEQGAQLSDTRYTQPCLYVVNALHYLRALREKPAPQFVAGHSLGEYNALQAAGVFDFFTGLRLVQKRGELMAQADSGSMAAVLGLEATRIAEVLVANELATVDIANYNSPSQIVISGLIGEVKRALPLLEAAGASMCIPLPVSGAFHSRYMERAASSYAEFVNSFEFAKPRIPVIANVTGQAYPLNASTQVIASLLIRQIVRPVQWARCLRTLSEAGVTSFIEVGPGQVLTRLLTQLKVA